MQDRTLLIVTGPGPDDDAEAVAALGDECSALCQRHDLAVDFRHTDDAAEMARWIAADGGNCAGLVVNPINVVPTDSSSLDALRSAVTYVAELKKPIAEVHWGNIFHDPENDTVPLHIPGAEVALVCGLGQHGYRLAINGIAARLEG